VGRGTRILGRSYILLPVIFGLAFLSACIAAPFVKVLNDELTKVRPLAKILTRCVVAFTMLYCILFRRFMRSKVTESLNQRISVVLKQLVAGLVIGAGMLGVLIAVFCLAGAKQYDPHFAASMIGKALVAALAVGLIEEILFRGVVLQNLHADMEAFFAVVFMAAFFAAMHFIQPLPEKILHASSAPSFNTFHVLNGFRAVPYQFANFARFGDIWPFFLGLALIGAALGVATIKTGSLYLPIGIHAGFVALNKLDGKLFHEVAGRSKLLFGVSKHWYMSYTDSLLCWIATAALIVLLILFGGKLRGRSGSGNA